MRPPGKLWRTVIRMDSGKSAPPSSRTIRIISVANVARPRTSPPNRSVRVFHTDDEELVGQVPGVPVQVDGVEPALERAAGRGAEPVEDVLDLLGAQLAAACDGSMSVGQSDAEHGGAAVGADGHDPPEARGEVGGDEPAGAVHLGDGVAQRGDVPVVR